MIILETTHTKLSGQGKIKVRKNIVPKSSSKITLIVFAAIENRIKVAFLFSVESREGRGYRGAGRPGYLKEAHHIEQVLHQLEGTCINT